MLMLLMMIEKKSVESRESLVFLYNINLTLRALKALKKLNQPAKDR